MTFLRAALFTLLAFAGSAALRAQVTPTAIFNTSGFDGSEITITFNSIANEVAITDQFAGQGVTFGGGLFGLTNTADLNKFSNPGGVIASDWRYSLDLTSLPSGTLPWTATFTKPQLQVGWLTEMWNGDTITVTTKLNSTVVGTVTHTNNGESLVPFFFGIKSTSGFDSISVNITGPNNRFIAIDDFRYLAIPEPSTVALLGAGLGLTAFLRLRRRRG